MLTRRELGDLQGALKGDIIMSLEIEATLECVTAREVPATWARYPYLHHLAISTISKQQGRVPVRGPAGGLH